MTAPLTLPDCDLQDFPFMPLHVARLRDSDLAATVDPEAAWFAVMLWAASWHQIPAGSLPDDEAVLARLCGLGRDVKTFRKRRAGAMHGFILCDDGRWYHPVVAEQANSAWKAKQKQRWLTECARIKKHNQRHNTAVAYPTIDDFIASGCEPVPLTATPKSPDCPEGHGSDVPPENTSKRQGEGEGQREYINDVDDGARARVALVIDNDPLDHAELADRAARAAGVRHIDPKRIANHIDLIREWLAGGATSDEIIETIQAVTASTSEPSHSLQRFSAHIRQTVARRENNHGTGAIHPAGRPSVAQAIRTARDRVGAVGQPVQPA
jgi:Protein of unknown function (DUF1376)